MNFIAIKDDNDNSFLINLDNIIAIAPYDGDKTKTSFHCTDCNRRVLPISFEKVEQVIDTLTNRNRRIRVDGVNLKGERLDVKVVNK